MFCNVLITPDWSWCDQSGVSWVSMTAHARIGEDRGWIYSTGTIFLLTNWSLFSIPLYGCQAMSVYSPRRDTATDDLLRIPPLGASGRFCRHEEQCAYWEIYDR